MPRQFSIASPLVRSVATTAAMVLILLGALGMAHLLSTSRQMVRQRIGTLELPIPPDWALAPSVPPAKGFEVQAQFHNSSGTRRLVVGLLAAGPTQEPIQALNRALNLLLDEQHRATFKLLSKPEGFRPGLRLGVLATGRSGGGGDAVDHVAIAMTEDGRRYWTLWLSLERADATQLLGEVSRLTRICGASVDHQRRDAKAEDFRAARLNPAAPAQLPGLSLRARSDVSRPAGTPIEFAGLTERPGLQMQMARILGTVDAAVDDASDPLSPPALLRATFREALGRLPVDAEQWSGRIDLPGGAGVNAWRVSYPLVYADVGDGRSLVSSLSRTVYYVRLARGRGMVIELTGDESLEELRRSWVPRLVDALAPPPSVAAAGGFGEAVERGVALIDAQQKQMPHQLEAGTRYYLLEHYGKSIGFGVERDTIAAPGQRPWQGRRWMATAGPTTSHLVQWAGSADGQRFWWLRTFQHAGEVSAGGQQLVRDGAELSLKRISADQTYELVWSTVVERGYLSPMSASFWPAAWLAEAGAEPILIWQSADAASPPRPCWVDRITAGDSEPNGESELHLRLRPMMSLDADHLTIDGAGRVVARYHEGRWPATDSAGSARGAVVRTVTRQVVLEVFGELASQLEAWEQEGPDHD